MRLRLSLRLPFGSRPASACEHARTALSDYLNGALDPAERAEIERHLAGCAGCRVELDALRAAVDLVRGLPAMPLPRSFTITAAETPTRLSWLPSAPALARSTAAAAGLFAVFLAASLAVQPPMAAAPAAPRVGVVASAGRSERPTLAQPSQASAPGAADSAPTPEAPSSDRVGALSASGATNGSAKATPAVGEAAPAASPLASAASSADAAAQNAVPAATPVPQPKAAAAPSLRGPSTGGQPPATVPASAAEPSFGASESGSPKSAGGVNAGQGSATTQSTGEADSGARTNGDASEAATTVLARDSASNLPLALRSLAGALGALTGLLAIGTAASYLTRRGRDSRRSAGR